MLASNIVFEGEEDAAARLKMDTTNPLVQKFMEGKVQYK